MQGEEGAQVGVDEPATELVMQLPGGVEGGEWFRHQELLLRDGQFR